MRYYEPGIRPDDGGGIDFGKSLVNRLEITQISDTSIQIEVETMNMTEEPSMYNVAYKDLFTNTITQVSPNPTTSTFTISGLTRGRKYDFTVQPIFENDTTTTPELKEFGFVMDEEIAGATLIGNSTDPKDITSNFYKGYLTLNSKVSEDKKYTVATRSFSAINLPVATQTLLPGGKNSASSYSEKYYSFGTSLKFAANIENGLSGGGMGFFTDDRANKGYYFIIETTASASGAGRQSLKWIKLQKGKNDVKVLSSSIKTAIYPGEIYNVDIRVKVSGFNITMTAYVNGISLSATDKTYYNTGTKKVDKLVAPTNKITLLCTRGKVHYDYVYGRDIEKSYYEDSSTITNKYYGQYSQDFLSTSFGQLNFKEKATSQIEGEYVDEFGTVAREIRKYDVQFKNAPADPVGWDTGINSAASILAEDWNNFSSTAWVLNNSSTTIPLSDGESVSFFLYGNPINESATLEYSTGDETDYGIKRPVVFETKWIQRSEDAESLGEWIKTQVINKGRVVKMQVFGNPLLQVGDVVSIKYDYQNFTGSESLVITNITHSFESGLKTNIVCRTI